MSETRYYVGDVDDLEGLSREDVEERTYATYEEATEAYEEYLNDVLGDVEIGSLSYPAGKVLRAVDPIAFRVGASDDTAEIDLMDYPSEEDADES